MTFRVIVVMPDTSTNPNDRPALAPWPTQAAAVDSSASSTRTSPPPMRVMEARSPPKNAGMFMMSVSAVFISTALISDGVRVG